LGFFFLFGAWLNAEAATDLTFAGVLGFLSNLLAAEATFFDVCSFADFLVTIIDPSFDLVEASFLNAYNIKNPPLFRAGAQVSREQNHAKEKAHFQFKGL
jgi:hypothetical protein